MVFESVYGGVGNTAGVLLVYSRAFAHVFNLLLFLLHAARELLLLTGSFGEILQRQPVGGKERWACRALYGLCSGFPVYFHF